jgi:hypothetical protein
LTTTIIDEERGEVIVRDGAGIYWPDAFLKRIG